MHAHIIACIYIYIYIIYISIFIYIYIYIYIERERVRERKREGLFPRWLARTWAPRSAKASRAERYVRSTSLNVGLTTNPKP